LEGNLKIICYHLQSSETMQYFKLTSNVLPISVALFQHYHLPGFFHPLSTRRR